MNYKKALIK